MAIQIDLADSSVGIPVPKAYVRIVGFGFDIPTGKLQVAIGAYVSEAASRAGKNPVTSVVLDGIMPKEFLPVLESQGRKVLYQWLKSMQTFQSATDLLENNVSGEAGAPQTAPPAPGSVEVAPLPSDLPKPDQLPS